MANASDIPNLPVSDVSEILSDEDCPLVSVLIPCYKRRKFASLILTNIVEMDYPKSKIEVCILQDGPEDLLNQEEREYFRKETGCKLNYKYEKDIRRSIGEKRNRLVKMASNKICVSMDSDDIYFPTYIRYSVSALKQYKVGITSSAQMLFLYPHYNNKITGIRCGHKHQGHEATAVFTKKHFNSMGGFVSRGAGGNQGEGVKMIAYNEKNMVNLDIKKLMICVVHTGEDGNTIDKDRFKDAEIEGNLEGMKNFHCLKKILGS
jgi:cellulose synthase/poly-beta-1,6-N-acetylglucosamine synthase-like glycosyltransferase